MAEIARIALRCRPALLDAFGAAFGLALPTRPLTASTAGPRAALWLGPDEWLLLAEDAPAAAIIPALEAARAGAAAVTDITDRQVALELEGPIARDLLAEGCPLDLEALPINGCARTLFGKAEVVVWRRAAEWWRLEVARSFAPHLEAHLAQAAADLG